MVSWKRCGSCMTAVGFLVGFEYHTTFAALVLGLLIVLLFSFALSWLSALLGLVAPNAETAQAAFFPVSAVLVFASAAFVPVDTMKEASVKKALASSILGEESSSAAFQNALGNQSRLFSIFGDCKIRPNQITG